jgi:hypothetical protein
MPSPELEEQRWIDGALFPDTDAPRTLDDDGARIDFLARLCAAWDFGTLPDPATIAQIRRSEWRSAVEACRLLTSPAYHLLRRWHGLEPLRYLGQRLAYIVEDPSLDHV